MPLQANPDTGALLVCSDGTLMSQCECDICLSPQYQGLWPPNGYSWTTTTQFPYFYCQYDSRYADTVQLYLQYGPGGTKFLMNTDNSPTYSSTWDSGSMAVALGLLVGETFKLYWYLRFSNDCGASYVEAGPFTWTVTHHPTYEYCDCQACFPTRYNKYYNVVFSGLPAGWAEKLGNGTVHKLTYTGAGGSSCTWRKEMGTAPWWKRIELRYMWIASLATAYWTVVYSHGNGDIGYVCHWRSAQKSIGQQCPTPNETPMSLNPFACGSVATTNCGAGDHSCGGLATVSAA